jgi:hypothetical protein
MAAKAAIHVFALPLPGRKSWMPACAGMTAERVSQVITDVRCGLDMNSTLHLLTCFT